MARSPEDLEGYLNTLERRFERLEDGTFLVGAGANLPPIALRIAPPVVVIQVAIGAAPSADSADAARLFRRLLELNAKDLLHAAYAIEDGTMVLSAARELDTLDINELEAVFADMSMALSEHVPGLRQLVKEG
jgi:hypothetical protein